MPSAEYIAELCRSAPGKACCVQAELYGALLYCNTFRAGEIRIITASPDFSARLPRLFWKAFSLNFDVLPPEEAVGKRSFCITDHTKIGRILEAFGSEANGPVAHHINLSVLEEPGCAEAFVRGAFLAGGSVTDPEKRFHLELATSHQSVSRELRSLLLELDLDPREASRGAHALLYFKKSDQIADFLAHIGAHVAAVSIHTAKVDK